MAVDTAPSFAEFNSAAFVALPSAPAEAMDAVRRCEFTEGNRKRVQIFRLRRGGGSRL